MKVHVTIKQVPNQQAEYVCALHPGLSSGLKDPLGVAFLGVAPPALLKDWMLEPVEMMRLDEKTMEIETYGGFHT